MENAGLAMQYGPKLELISYIDHSRPFFSLCKNIKIVIKKLKTKHLIFLVKQRNHDLVLGQLFLYLIKFSQEYKPDSIFDTIIYLYT